MNLRPAGLGAEPKKLILLASVLVLGGGTVYWANRSDVPASVSPSPASVVKNPALPPPPTAPGKTSSYGPRTAGRGGRAPGSGDDFRPTLKLPEGIDLSRVDPTLKLDLLSKLRQVPVQGGPKSLFEFYTPPPPPPPKVEPIKPLPPKPEFKQPEAPKGPPPTPPPPPIPLKFYGYSGALRATVRRAFFLDGEDIVQAGENELIRNRYKIVRIGVNSAVVEDTVAKNQQTLPLAEEAQ